MRRHGCRRRIFMKHDQRRILLPALLLALLLSGCAARQAKTECYAMDTVMDITVYGKNAEQAAKDCEQELYRLEALLSCREPEAELAQVNAGQAEPSAETAALVRHALELSRETGGAYDPALGALMEAWGFSTGECRVPDVSEREAALRRCGAELIELTEDSFTLRGGAQLDLGGIGKGYAAARLRALLTQEGIESAILSLGGNVCAVGAKPDGSDWQIGLQDPENTAEIFGMVAVRDAGVVTSGGYQRWFEQDGVRYHHILDPETGCPAESGLLSVSVVSADDTLADALSTALYVMGAERGARLWRESGLDFEAVWVTEDGSVLITEGLQSAYRSERAYQVVTR